MRDTIDMAREAGIEFQHITGILGKETISTMGSQRLERIEQLVALVRADEREACAKVCEAEAEMFKSCADGANDGRYDWKEDGARDCAVALRARGNT
jgi:hypothetical protein